MKTRLLLSLLGSLLLACAVRAQVISYVAPLHPELSLPVPPADGSALSLPGFDTSLGLLTGVRFTFDGYASQQAQGENIGASASTYSYNVTSTLTLARDGGPQIFSFAPVTIAGSGNLTAFDGAIDFAGGSGFYSTRVNTPLTGIYDVPAELVADYLSLVPIEFTALLTGSAKIVSSGNLASHSSNGASGTLGVTYTYAPIPEPSAYAAAAGLAALAAAALRRRRAPA